MLHNDALEALSSENAQSRAIDALHARVVALERLPAQAALCACVIAIACAVLVGIASGLARVSLTSGAHTAWNVTAADELEEDEEEEDKPTPDADADKKKTQ
jgi:hypothetical protein